MIADETVVYALTRDRELATMLDARLRHAIAFFYNDAARLHQAVILRTPDLVLVDTAAIRPEYGDAGLAPVLHFLHERVPAARLAVRPMPGAEQLIAAEAGAAAELLPAEAAGCIEAVLAACGCG
ncbi:MAG TPA: hypothetical protein VFM74_01915 [Candidatus Limnocylindria bacterium]|nr:hypothetical protein [Candidatus Limnocylindria bacterium]